MSLSPEETSKKLEQGSAVSVEAVGPWKNSEDMWTFQNYDDLEEYGPEIVSGGATPVLVIDNEDAVISYEQNKHYYILAELDYGSGTMIVQINHLTEYFSILVEEGTATLEEVNGPIDFIGAGAIKIDSYQGYPIYIRDPAIDDNRPETQTSSTTGATTGTTVKTTTTAKVGAAGVVTESETIPSPTLDAFGGAGAPVQTSSTAGTPTSKLDALGIEDILYNGEALAALAKGAKTSKDPCLPNNPPVSQVQGNGATPPATSNPLDAFGGAGPAVGAANPLDAFGGAGPNILTQTAPTTITQQPSTPTVGQSTTPTNSRPNVYIYEPVTPGFDRYDFNSGKKVFTTNNGTTMTSSGQQLQPPATPATTTSAASAEAAGYGSSQYGEFGPVSKSAPNIPTNLTGPF